MKAYGCKAGLVPHVPLVVFDFVSPHAFSVQYIDGWRFNPGRRSLRELALGCLASAPSVRNPAACRHTIVHRSAPPAPSVRNSVTGQHTIAVCTEGAQAGQPRASERSSPPWVVRPDGDRHAESVRLQGRETWSYTYRHAEPVPVASTKRWLRGNLPV